MNRYDSLIQAVFLSHFVEGTAEFEFERSEIEEAARRLRIKLPKNLGDVLYTFRYRAELPERIRALAPEGMQWVIESAGRGRYRFRATSAVAQITPNDRLLQIKVPDATPGLIAMYALSDEQALLAKLRYNRLLDIFTRVSCYSLQSHLRTFVTDVGQVETDEIYVGVDRNGAHYVFPVQAKGGRDALNVVQIAQDMAMCSTKFPDLVCRAVGAQFMAQDLIAMFEFAEAEGDIRIATEKHYRLVPPDELSAEDLERYRRGAEQTET